MFAAVARDPLHITILDTVRDSAWDNVDASTVTAKLYYNSVAMVRRSNVGGHKAAPSATAAG